MGAEESKKKTQDLFDLAMEMRMASKSFQKESKRAEMNQMKEQKKVADYIKQGKREIAQIHAENALRNKKDAINLARLSAQMGAVESQIKSAERAGRVFYLI